MKPAGFEAIEAAKKNGQWEKAYDSQRIASMPEDFAKRMTAKQLENELEIHIRTVYRYIDSLCASGVPLIADSELAIRSWKNRLLRAGR